MLVTGMFAYLRGNPILLTLFTLAFGGLGAAMGYALSFPVFVLTGPAILITVLGLMGVPFAIPDTVRDAAFLIIGIGIGAGVDAEATAAFLRWPLAFVALAVMLTATLLICRFLLRKYFGYDARSAILASSPGHLSYILSLGSSINVDVGLITIVQSVRLLSLTLFVPLVAMMLGADLGGTITQPGPYMAWLDIALLLVASIALGVVLLRFNVPAALLLGGMFASTAAHISQISIGTMPPVISLPCFLIVGTLIGTRFSGITLDMLKRGLFAGVLATLVAVGCALAAAWPISVFLDMPLSHVLIAFAPGGLETMIAMGIVLGANPGFVAACHVGRLFLLTLLVPALLGLRDKGKNP